MESVEKRLAILERQVRTLESTRRAVDDLPYWAELSFGKPIQKFKVRAATEEELNQKVLDKIQWVQDNLHRSLAGE